MTIQTELLLNLDLQLVRIRMYLDVWVNVNISKPYNSRIYHVP
jgi:hypothetical protein